MNRLNVFIFLALFLLIIFQDWNDFLAGFSNVQFCMVSDDMDATNTTDDDGHIGGKNYKEVISDVHSKLKGETETTHLPSSSEDVL